MLQGRFCEGGIMLWRPIR